MKKQNFLKGKTGESIAANFLEKNGFKIIEKNWRFSRLGEIDIIAEHENILVFVEVKTRSSNLFGQPLESVDERKFNKIKKLAEIYLSRLEINNYSGIRFDLVGILFKNPPEITYFKNVY
jgi:putative endonuclease